jgi:hypothetical protein
MTKLGIPTKLVNLTKMTMGNSMGRMKIQGVLSQPFTIQNGLRQGDPLSTTLFNLALEYDARKITVNPGGTLCQRSEDAFVITCVANLMEVKVLYVQQDLRYEISSYWRFNV